MPGPSLCGGPIALRTGPARTDPPWFRRVSPEPVCSPVDRTFHGRPGSSPEVAAAAVPRRNWLSWPART